MTEPTQFPWNNFFLAIIAALAAWQRWQSHKTSKVVDQIHALTNSAMGVQKLTLAETSAAKAAITHDPIDIEAARVAMEDYLNHLRKQNIVDKGIKSG